MTAEIALLNKLAVTLAADSAVTIGAGEATKVYNSADKIFEGTNLDPIGVMVFNSPELNGVPIESIIKMYRDRHCTNQFATVFDYADAFLQHLERLDAPQITINSNIQGLAYAKIMSMQALVRQATEDFFRTVGSGEREVAQEHMLATLEAELLLLLEAEELSLRAIAAEPWNEGLTEAQVTAVHGDTLTELVEAVFDGDTLVPAAVKIRIVSVAVLALLREYQRPRLTGLVFAGFGRDEIFPSLVAYEVYGVVAGRLKYRQTNQFNVDRQLFPDAAIIPFAQREMVDRFIYGLDGEFIQLTETYFAGALTRLKAHLGEFLADNDAANQAIAPAIDVILSEFTQSVVPDHLNRSHQQLSDMVRSMPKQELAALCESLIHITSLKRRFNAGAESVGGPIDVAMITRAEGFVWVKRKHYFDPTLNPRFFHRRYGSGVGAAGPQGHNGEAER